MSKFQMESMEQFVKEQTDFLRGLWYSCKDGLEYLPETISITRKLKNEEILSDHLDWVGRQLEDSVRNSTERLAFTEEASSRLKVAGKSIFDLNDDQVNCLEGLGINRSAEAFYRQAREFDPSISFEDIFQASRNVWTSNYLQVLLALPVELTPSLFAYSMLYPVSDNYLDDPHRSRAKKSAYNQRFRSWLKGEKAIPQNKNEQDVYTLVQMIEEQYPRDCFPQVYASMLAIHNAQDKSMRLPKIPLTPNSVDIVGLTFEKGGTSVLADGVLAAGELTCEQMKIIFNYGAFAQLMDDQEDIDRDLKVGAPTVFSEAARIGKVDQVMDRVFSFAHFVLQGLDKFDNPRALPLKQMSMKGINLLLIDAVFRMEKYYSSEYLQELEKHFPFRFEYLKRVRKTIARKKITTERLAGLMFSATPSVNSNLIDQNQWFLADRAVFSER